MNAPRIPPRFVPTLTEVVELSPTPTPAEAPEPELLVSDEPLPVVAEVAAATPTEDVPAFLLATQPVVAAVAVAPAVSAPEAQTEAAVVAPDAQTTVEHTTEREAQIVHNVLAELQQRADLMLEYRLRETLSPILARLCDALIKEARQDLATTLRDVVSRAVAQELARQRQQTHPHESKNPSPGTH